MRKLVTFAGAAIMALAIPSAAMANTYGPETFSDFQIGSPAGQSGWTLANPAYDHKIVENTGAQKGQFGDKSLRISNAYTTGAFDQTYSAPVAPASDAVADHTFVGEFQYLPVKSTQQQNLKVSVSPTNSTGSRMSYVRLEDQSDGVHVYFDEVRPPAPGSTSAEFIETDIATLNRTKVHTIRIDMKLLLGRNNDQVKVYIDGKSKISGKSWENYYRDDAEQAGNGNIVPVTDRLTFLTRSGNLPDGENFGDLRGNGFLFDNVKVGSS
jgi:hypothetical protein